MIDRNPLQHVVLSLLLAFFFQPSLAAADDLNEDVVSSAQKTAIDQKIQDYLAKNPKAFAENTVTSPEKELQRVIQLSGKDLVLSATTPSAGPAKAKVYVIEFFDYQCGYCKKSTRMIEKLISKNSDVKFLFKEFPIFGENSEFMSKAALAAHLQKSYLPMHLALMKHSGLADPSTLTKLATDLKLNIAAFKKDMNGSIVEKELNQNYQLGKRLGLGGTPIFIVTNFPIKPYSTTFYIPGMPTESEMQNMLNQAKATAQ